MPKGSANASKTHCPQGHSYAQNAGSANGLGTRVCKMCRRNQMNARNALRVRTDDEKTRNWERSLKRNFGITAEDYYSLLSVVPGCAMCGKTPEENGQRLAVDHGHDTGRARGLLCLHCNSGIGFLKEGKLFPAAKEYLGVL